MDNINIPAFGQVKLEFEAAPVISRILAQVIDIILYCFILLIVGLFSGGSSIAIMVAVIIFFLYLMFQESLFKGQTIGKKALGIKVIRLDGKPCSTTDYLIRWFFSVFDILSSSGLLAIGIIINTKHNQRLGDLFANTSVVKIPSTRGYGKTMRTSFKKLMQEDIVYKEAGNLHNEHVLLIKETIERYHKIKNEHSLKCIDELYLKTCDILNLNKELSEQKNTIEKIELLKQLLKDYIKSTR